MSILPAYGLASLGQIRPGSALFAHEQPMRRDCAVVQAAVRLTIHKKCALFVSAGTQLMENRARIPPAVKLTIAIPLVGYSIIFNESLLHYLDLSRELFGQPHTSGASAAHVSWRLLVLYFGLCFIAAGAALTAGTVQTKSSPTDCRGDYINVLRQHRKYWAYSYRGRT